MQAWTEDGANGKQHSDWEVGIAYTFSEQALASESRCWFDQCDQTFREDEFRSSA